MLTIPEVAQRLRVGRMTVYRLIAAGELERIKIGAAARVPETSLTAYLVRAAA